MRIAAVALLGFATLTPRPDGAAGCLAGSDDVVVVRVSATPSQDDVRIAADCPGWQIDRDGDTLTLDPGWFAGDCSLRALRTDGALTVRSAPVHVEPGPGTLHAAFALPDDLVGGAGMSIASTCRGITLVGVVPGGPADRAGLHAGQRIVSVDGEAIGHDTWDVIDRTVGEIGSEVTVTVANHDGSWQQVTLERAWIEADWWSQVTPCDGGN